MDIRKLDLFCKLVELKSFTRTAEVSKLSQPTVSEHIRSLESELGHKLVNRLGREVEPTPVGHILYGYARKLIRLRHEAKQAVSEFSGTLSGRMHVGASTIPGTYILPSLIAEFRNSYPSVRASLSINGSRLIAEDVLNGDIELAVIGARWSEKAFHWKDVFEDELCVVVNARHPWALNEKPILPGDLAGQPFIFREQGSGTRRTLEQLLDNHDVNPALLDEVAEIGSTAAIKEAVKAGIGVSILSRRAIEQEERYGLLKAVNLKNIRLSRCFSLIWRKKRELSPVGEQFRRFLLDVGSEE